MTGMHPAHIQSVAILGVSGQIAQALLRALEHHEGIDRIVGVDVNPPHHHPRSLEFHPADLRQAPLGKLMRGVDGVVHLAGPLVPSPSFADTLREGERIAADMQRVVEGALEAGARRLVVLTSVAAYGAHADNPIPIQEWRPLRPNPDIGLAHAWAHIDRTLEALTPQVRPLQLIRLRCALPVGPDMEPARAQILTAPRVLLPLEKPVPVQLVHTDDLASAILRVLEAGERPLYHVAAPEPCALPTLFEAVGTQVIQLPRGMLEALSRLAWRAGRGRVPHDMLLLSRYPIHVSTVALRHDLGWQARYSTLEAFVKTHQALKAAR